MVSVAVLILEFYDTIWCVPVLSMRRNLKEQPRLVDGHMDLERDAADFLGTESMSHRPLD